MLLTDTIYVNKLSGWPERSKLLKISWKLALILIKIHYKVKIFLVNCIVFIYKTLKDKKNLLINNKNDNNVIIMRKFWYSNYRLQVYLIKTVNYNLES